METSLEVCLVRDRLEHRLSILTGGPRDTTPRQQTMRNTIAWSYELLDAPRRSFLRALSVFDDGWDLEASGKVADLDETEALAAISALVDQSLASLVPAGDALPRYRMLDVVREFASERADDEAETDELRLRRRHGGAQVRFRPLGESQEMRGMRSGTCTSSESHLLPLNS